MALRRIERCFLPDIDFMLSERHAAFPRWPGDDESGPWGARVLACMWAKVNCAPRCSAVAGAQRCHGHVLPQDCKLRHLPFRVGC